MARHHRTPGTRRERMVEQRRGDAEAIGASRTMSAFAMLATQIDRPSVRLRLRVSAQASALDDELARGASPLDSRELALRARQLVDPQRREQLANALESLLEQTQRGRSPRIIDSLPRREITAAGADLVALARRLRDPAPIYARGAAMVSRLLRNRAGPAFTPEAGGALRRALEAATAAIDGADNDDRLTYH